MTQHANKIAPLRQLQQRWWGVTAVFVVTILAFYLILRAAFAAYALRWLGITSLTAVYCLWILRRHLPENHRAEETAVLPWLGWGNRLTILRGLLVSMVAGFLFSPWPGGWLAWLPALFYTAADLADFFDGYAARKTNHATRLGERLDMEFDGLGTLIVTLLAVWYAQLPWWYLLIGLARYVFVFGLWLRAKIDKPIHPMAPSWHRRIFAGFQMGFLSVVLWPIVPAAGATITGTLFALATSASFLRDWLVVIGWLNPQAANYRQWQRRLYRLLAGYLPPAVRAILAVCVVVLVGQTDQPWQPAAWIDLFTSWHLPWPAIWASFFALAGGLAALFVTIGAMGRLLAIFLLFPLGFDMVVNGPTVANGLALAGAVIIMLLGTGALSLWQPEERFMVRRAGEDED